MPLVEIIVGAETSDRAIAAAIDYVVAINTIPIVVNDNRGFYTSRCFGTNCAEGSFLLEEGVPAAMIENVAKTKGMPVGPLAVTDEVSLTLGMHVYESDPSPEKHPSLTRGYNIQKLMVKEYGREGKKSGKGYYDYPYYPCSKKPRAKHTCCQKTDSLGEVVWQRKYILHIQYHCYDCEKYCEEDFRLDAHLSDPFVIV